MKINKGNFVKTKVCPECDWFQAPQWRINKICPICGSKLKTAIGQFEYTKSIFGGIKIINFIKK